MAWPNVNRIMWLLIGLVAVQTSLASATLPSVPPDLHGALWRHRLTLPGDEHRAHTTTARGMQEVITCFAHALHALYTPSTGQKLSTGADHPVNWLPAAQHTNTSMPNTFTLTTHNHRWLVMQALLKAWYPAVQPIARRWYQVQTSAKCICLSY